MSPQPQEGPADGGLSSSVLPLVDDPERIDRLRHLLSGFNHRCRNSLNGIKMSLYLSKREWNGLTPPCWHELEQTYQEIERLFDRLHFIYRPLCMTMVRSPLGQLVAERLPSWRSLFTRTGRTLEVDPPPQEARGDFDPMHLGLGLDAFIAWRADQSAAKGNPRLSWRIDTGCFEIAWRDGHSQNTVDSPETETCYTDETSRPSRVDCLALPLLARIVSAHGGSQEAMRDPTFGLTLRWPQFYAGDSRTGSECGERPALD
jgi:hypothetical protein